MLGMLRIIPAYLHLEMDRGFWYVEMHNMAYDIQLVAFPNNMVLLSGFSKKKKGYLNKINMTILYSRK